MEFIINNIKTDRTMNIPIKSNEFEDSYKEGENLFPLIEDIIDVYKKNKYTQPPPKQQQEKIIETYDSLFLCILEYLEPTLSLSYNTKKINKIEELKKTIKINITSIILLFKKNMRDDIKNSIQNKDLKICHYLSKLVKKNIIINDEKYGDYEDCICILYNEELQQYIVDKVVNKNNLIDDYKKDLLENNILNIIDTLLIKNLKDICVKLEIPLFKLENNIKKNLIKSELKESILKKLKD